MKSEETDSSMKTDISLIINEFTPVRIKRDKINLKDILPLAQAKSTLSST
jgi:hypothetical protein